MRITLRAITVEDTDLILRWRNSESVRKNFLFRQKLTREAHLNWLHQKEAYQFIILDASDDKPLGSVYLRDFDSANRKAEFGIYLGEESARGKGVGTEAARLILSFAFERLELNRVFLRVISTNLRAIRSYEKAGFIREGCFRQDVILQGQPTDIVFMAILKEDYYKDRDSL